ncbi:MAG: hypothetical protein KJP00_03780 [Bacteroidia bacterium]|nr:hypothetical protein [Bacteroidia bacterium]
MIPGLIDHRNAALLKELEQDFTIKVEVVRDTEQYGCYSKEYESTIYVPESKISPPSFTHELLHIYLRSKEIYIGSRIQRRTQASKRLSIIYTEPLLDHIGNCLDHIKMLPIYLKLGYTRNQFLNDYKKHKCTHKEIEQIKEHWKHGQEYNASAIEFYLEKYFAIQACPNTDIDYSKQIQELRLINEPLFLINEKLIRRWTAMKIEGRDVSDDDYIIIAEDYVKEMEGWAALRSII